MARMREIRRPWGSPPPLGTRVRSDADIRNVMQGGQFIDQAADRPWDVSGAPTVAVRQDGPAAILSRASGSLSQASPLPPAAGWTLAAIVIPVSFPVSGQGLFGFGDGVGSATFDRQLQYYYSSSGGFRVYAYDGATKYASLEAAGMIAGGVPRRVVMTCSATLLTIYVDGYGSASVAVSNSGHTGYSTPTLCLNRSDSTANDIQFDLPLFVRADSAWPAEKADAWLANPWAETFEAQRVPVPVSAAAPSIPTLSASTYKPGTLTSSGWQPRITAT